MLHVLGHDYRIVFEGEGLIVLDGEFPGEGGPYSLQLDVSRGEVPLSDLIDQIEIAGIDRAAFLAQPIR